MNYRENEDNLKLNKSQSIVMDLENLHKNYTNLLAKYKAAVYEYTNFLSEHVNESKKKQIFVSIKGKAFSGTGTAGVIKTATPQDCEAKCANLSRCTGATFVSNKCFLRTGDSPIMLSNKNSYAIIPKSKQLLLNMEDINQQLITINNKIMRRNKIVEPIYDKYSDENSNKTQELISNYKDLMLERENILNLLREYETLDKVDNENHIKIKKNYYSYILLCILAIGILFLLYKFYSPSSPPISPTPSIPFTNPVVQNSGELGINAYYIVFCLILFIIGIHYFNKYFPN